MLTYFVFLASKILTNNIFIILLLHVQKSKQRHGNGPELGTVVPGGTIGQLKVTKAWTSTVS